jgi:hypothetical protein
MDSARTNLQRHESPHERRIEGRPIVEHLRGSNQQTIPPKPLSPGRLVAKDRA